MAVSYVGVSNLIATNGGAPGAITASASTQVGDLLVFYHYSRASTINETVTPPSGFTTVVNTVVPNVGLVAVAYRVRQSGDTTYTASVTNHSSGTSGETILEFIETYRGQSSGTAISGGSIVSYWQTSSLILGPSPDQIIAPTTDTVEPGDMAIVFAGRFENITAQTTLTGDNLTWTARTLNNTTLGLDAACVTQNGLNNTGTNQVVSDKSITTTGTAQVGAGTIFIIKAETITFTPNDPFGSMGIFGL